MGPQLLTELPGPKARAILDEERRCVSPSLTPLYPLVAEHAEGCWVWDVDGNRFLDFTSGLGVAAAGHSHPRLLDAMQMQLRRLAHFSAADFHHEPYIRLADRLARLAPGDGAKKVFLCNSGAEAIEAAIKLARQHTRRQRLVAFHGAFHGRTFGALALTASKTVQQHGFGPGLPGVTHVTFDHAGLDQLEQVHFRTNVPPDEVAAIVFEPIQGEGGCRMPEADLLPRLRQICDRHGILLVADEVQTGLGRTGKMFAVEHWRVAPDILCLAKALGGGLPLGAVIARAGVMDWPNGAHASTFGGNPVACAAALALLDLLEGGLIQQAAARGNFLRAELSRLAHRHGRIHEVRGLGLMLGIDFQKTGRQPAAATDERDTLLRRAFEQGLLLLAGGGSVARLMPPLTLSPLEAEVGIELLNNALADEEARREAA